MMLRPIIDCRSIIWGGITIQWLNMIVENLRLLIEWFEVKLLKVCVLVFCRPSFLPTSVIYLTTLSLLATFDCELFATIRSIATWVNRKGSFCIINTRLLEWNHVRVNNIEVLWESVGICEPTAALDRAYTLHELFGVLGLNSANEFTQKLVLVSNIGVINNLG